MSSANRRKTRKITNDLPGIIYFMESGILFFMNIITIFTDGSSRGNPGPGGWGSVVVREDIVVELGGREETTTNNRMELTAAIEALKHVKESGSTLLNVIVYTDSRYVINGITQWVFGWMKNGWITGAKEEVQNKDLWEKLVQYSQGLKIEWKYIGGHKGIVGNERCDEIATQFADKENPELYSGHIKDYRRDILNISIDESKAEKRSASRKRSNTKAYSYVSSVDGIIQTHASWAECEARVKGKKGARFKKALDQSDETQIMEEFRK